MELTVCLINTSAVLCVIFGFYIYRLDTKSGLYQLFLLLCLIFSVLAFITGRIFTVTDREDMFFWDRIYAYIAFICWAINLNFFLLLTEKKLKSYQIAFIYIPSIILIVLEYTCCPVVADFVKAGDRWKYIYSPSYYFYMFYSVSYGITDMVLVYRWGKYSRQNKQRLQANAILYMTIILWIVCIATDYVLSQFEFYKFPPFGAIGRVIYAVIIWYSFVRYRFLVPGSSILLNEIVLNVQESVLLVDRNFKIIMYNKKFSGLLGLTDKSFADRGLFEFAAEDEEVANNLQSIVRRELNTSNGRLVFIKEKDKVVTDSVFTGIVDKFGDFEGVLIISNENRDIRYFKEKFKLSDRQMEIIDLALIGLSNSEISERLSISKKTTEAHFVNIYNKLGVNNKIELYNMAIEYNLVLKKTALSD